MLGEPSLLFGGGMKRSTIQLDDIASWDNLTRAVERAARGKRYRAEVVEFLAHLDDNLTLLRAQILAGVVSSGWIHSLHGRFRVLGDLATTGQGSSKAYP